MNLEGGLRALAQLVSDVEPFPCDLLHQKESPMITLSYPCKREPDSD